MNNKRVKLIKLRGSRSQSEIAVALGISIGYYGMIETGARDPSLKLAKKIADFFNKKIEWIFFAN